MSGPRITEWSPLPTDPDIHSREVGAFTLFVEDVGGGWAWSAEWGDNEIAAGTEWVVGTEDYDGVRDRAKAACEDATRKAGIAVPLA